mmetsp:Transcript_36100/g.60112  ORF Transcript_36100/g.60112 Transcript_36100/m.60112 type:complete len:170 (+) Transcript_36100:97-606(+)
MMDICSIERSRVDVDQMFLISRESSQCLATQYSALSSFSHFCAPPSVPLSTMPKILPAATRAANLYTDDGAFESAFGNYYGKSQILYGFHVVFGRNTKWSTHFIMSPIIVFTSATTAVGDWYFYAPVVLAGTAHAPVTPFYGGYKDIYQKVNGVWKIKKTTVVYFTPPS